MADKILVVEDDEGISGTLYRGLTFEGYKVNVVYDGLAALASARDDPPDLVILDWMLPGLDGLEVCRRLRAAGPTPILMLTAKDAIADRVQGLDAGADDYLVKPFRPRELAVRVQALLRRSSSFGKQEAPDAPLACGPITLDPLRRRVTVDDRPVQLAKSEFSLLHYLILNKGIVLSASRILANVWGYEMDESEDIVKMTVSRLRHKVEPDPLHPSYIKTVRGIGYVIQE